jgi:hypothetical protein
MNTLRTITAIAAAAALVAACDSSGAKEQVDHGAAGKPSTLTGCITNGDNGRSFVLQAENEPQPQGNEVSGRPASAPNVYRLEGDRRQDIENNVGAHVKVTGHLETIPVHASGDSGGTLKPAPTSGANVDPQDYRGDVLDMRVFRVTSLEKTGPC